MFRLPLDLTSVRNGCKIKLNLVGAKASYVAFARHGEAGVLWCAVETTCIVCAQRYAFERNACNVYARSLHLSRSCLQRVCLRQFAVDLLTEAGPAHTLKVNKGVT